MVDWKSWRECRLVQVVAVKATCDSSECVEADFLDFDVGNFVLNDGFDLVHGYDFQMSSEKNQRLPT